MTVEQIKAANRTSRKWKTTAIDQVIRSVITRNHRVLDFGAGKHAVQAVRLRNEGYQVTAYDFGNNCVPGIHDPKALSRHYDVVYASNVLNVQSSVRMLHETISQIRSVLRRSGMVLANYPKDPRMLGYSEKQMLNELCKCFRSVEKYSGTKNVIWVMK